MRSLYATFEGDSLTTGQGSSGGNTYPVQLIRMFTDNRMVSMVNVATSGETLADMATEAASQIDNAYDSRKPTNITVIWGGTNDLYLGVLGDFSGAGAYARLLAYGQARQAIGEKVVVVNCLPRQNAGVPVGFEAQRVIFNALIASGWQSFANALADVAADSRLQDPTNTTYFDADKVHLNNTGYAVVAGIVFAQVSGLA